MSLNEEVKRRRTSRTLTPAESRGAIEQSKIRVETMEQLRSRDIRPRTYHLPRAALLTLQDMVDALDSIEARLRALELERNGLGADQEEG